LRGNFKVGIISTTDEGLHNFMSYKPNVYILQNVKSKIYSVRFQVQKEKH